MKWKILSSEYLFRDLWFTVRKDICETPDGKIIDPYYVYEFPTWVSALAITEDNQVVMVRQYRHGIEETILEVPGGCVDDTDKSLETAIARELAEETGYSFKDTMLNTIAAVSSDLKLSQRTAGHQSQSTTSLF